MKKIVSVNERGYLIGDSHHFAKITNEEAEKIRELRERYGMTYKALSEKFGIGESAISKICLYKRRWSTVIRFKKVSLSE